MSSALFKLLPPQEFIQLSKNALTRKQRVVPVDATWYLPNVGRNGREEFLNEERIPGAVFFDIDAIKDRDSPYPHMAPTKNGFTEAMNQFGLVNSDILVVYDRIGNFSAPRCAWTLKLFGHENVYLLNNFNVYKALKLSLDTNKVTSLSPYPRVSVQEDQYKVTRDISDEQIVSFEEMIRSVQAQDFVESRINLFDARANGRFKGVDNEPRPDISSGHIAGAKSLPFIDLLDPQTKQFPTDPSEMQSKINETLKKYNGGKVDLNNNKQTIVMCGTGVTGAIIKTALDHAGIKNIKLYDGSWTEWVLRNGNDSDLIVKNK